MIKSIDYYTKYRIVRKEDKKIFEKSIISLLRTSLADRNKNREGEENPASIIHSKISLENRNLRRDSVNLFRISGKLQRTKLNFAVREETSEKIANSRFSDTNN